MKSSKKHLGLRPLIDGFKQALVDQADNRSKPHSLYTLEDAALSGLACMFYKSEDMLKFQKSLKNKYHRNNLETQFGVVHTPADTQMRELIAALDPTSFADVFKEYQTRLQRSKYLSRFQFQGEYLAVIDGTQYHCSEKISCPDCLTRTKRNGEIEYSHKVLQPIICHPEQKQILPMMPEPIKAIDGQDKQDCETNAGKRLLPKLRQQHPRMDFIWVADSLFATAPFINAILEHQESFLFRVKKGDHGALFSHIGSANYESHKTIVGNNTLAMRWYHDVPLNKSSDLTVTVIKAFVISIDKQGKKTSTVAGVWATNLEVTSKTVTEITQAARSRWKIENECFNTVKNQGYALTHN
jgi:hypothetical protein